MANGNGKKLFILRQGERVSPIHRSDMRATWQEGKAESITDKGTGKTTTKPTVWGPETEVPLRRITHEEFLRGSSFDPSQAKQTKPRISDAEMQKRRRRMRAFAGVSPVPAH